MWQAAVCWVSPAARAARAVPVALLPCATGGRPSPSPGSPLASLLRAPLALTGCRRRHGGTYLLLQLLFSGFVLPGCEGRALPWARPWCKVARVIEEHMCVFCLKLEQPMLCLFPKEVFICAGASVLNFQLPLFEPVSLFIY